MSTVEVIKGRDQYRIGELRSFDFAALARSGGMKRETPETAPEVPAVIACIRVIAESVGSLPLHIYRMDANGAKVLATESPLYRLMRYAPNDEQTSLELREQLTMLYLLYGDAYCELQRDDRGTITAMMPLHPSRMTTERLTDGSLRYICRAFRVPPHLVQSLDGATYSNIEHQSREFLTYTLLPHLRRIEDSIARDLIDDPTLFAEHDVHAFMRGDSAARAAWYQQALTSGIMSINEVRAAEGMNPIGPEGDERFLQVNMTTLKRLVAGDNADGT